MCWTGYPSPKPNKTHTNKTHSAKCKCKCARVKAVIKIKGITEDQFASKDHMDAFLETVAIELGGATTSDDVKIVCAKKSCRVKVSSQKNRRDDESVEVEFTVDADDEDVAVAMSDSLIDTIDDGNFAAEFSELSGLADVETELTYGPEVEEAGEESSEDDASSSLLAIVMIITVVLCCCGCACIFLMMKSKSSKGDPEAFTELNEDHRQSDHDRHPTIGSNAGAVTPSAKFEVQTDA